MGFDVGGTFTDIVVVDGAGRLAIEKVLTTPHDPSVAAREGIEAVLRRLDVPLDDVALGIHGTTLVANAIIERRGAATALLTTLGFHDLLEIGGGTRYDMYDLFLPFPSPLVERRLRRGVPGRIAHDGTELEPLDEKAVRRTVREFVEEGVEAVAICFLHSYASDRHELLAAELVRREFPELHSSLSSDVVRQLGEYERFSTTVANAYVQPLMTRYLEKLDDWLRGGRLLLMNSSGGTVSISTAKRWPIQLIESGPAAGALAAADHSSQIGRSRVVSFDMGGTTAKICLIDDGMPQTTQEFEAAREERFKPGSGIPLRIPVINLIEIGAGGGSLARVDELGLLKVGPASAGADPGPACYRRGGREPTVTDANLVLGYLGADSFLGGAMRLDTEAAQVAIAERVAQPLGLHVLEGAWGIHEIVNENMASAMRTHIAERNRDPRRYSLIAFGGAGPGHAVAVARKVGIPDVIVPLGAGAASAAGLLIAPAVIDLVHSHVGALGNLDWRTVAGIFESLGERAISVLAEAGVKPEDVSFERSVDMRYVGQAHEITVGLGSSELDERGEAELLDAFTRRYSTLYSVLNPDFGVEVLNWRLRALGPRRELELVRSLADRNGGAAPGARPVYFPEKRGFIETHVCEHRFLKPGETYQGPLIVEQREATVVVGPHDALTVDDRLNLLITVGGGSSA